MGFRTVVLSNRAKIDFRLNYMVIRGEEEKQIFIPDINTVIFQSTAISLTAVLLCELIKNRVKLIFCDEKHNPHSELLPYYGSYNSSKKIGIQFLWQENSKALVWKSIVTKKIQNQAQLLAESGFIEKHEMLINYAAEVLPYDTSNSEGHAAKVYFNVIFGDGFTRGSDNLINRSLNYGYAILLSSFNREIVSAGYLTQLGIFHKNEFNDFNLSCDFMEPFRTIVDKMVLEIKDLNNFKPILANLFNLKVRINGFVTTLDNAIKIYVRSLLDCLNSDDFSLVKYVESYEL